MLSVRALVTALILGAGLLAVPATAPSPVAGIGPLPACRLDDIRTVPRDYEDGPITLVDHILSLGKGYEPPDLVPVGKAGVAGGGSVRRIALDDLRAMAAAAEANGTPLVARSSYRGYRQQKKLFRGYARDYGFDEAITFSARPGHSEHQLGLAIDFVAVGDTGLTSNWDETPTGGWMARNAWEYGWLMSYPKGEKDVTCYSFEPWHYRYVGRDVAAEIHESGLTPREYLWANFSTVDPTTGEPVPTATVLPSSPASPGSSPEESVTPTPSAVTSQPTGPGATQLPASSPAASSPPPSDAGRWFGVDPPVVVASLLLVIAAVGFVVSLGLRRRSRRS